MNILEYISYSLIMVIGPQIIVPISLLLNKDVRNISLAYIIGVFTSTITTISLLSGLMKLFGEQLNALFSYQGNGSIKIILFIALFLLSIKTFIKRKEDGKSKFVELAVNGSAKNVLIIALLLFAVFPTDLMVNVVMAKKVVLDGNSFLVTVIPLALINVFFVSLPYVLFLMFKEKISKAIPSVRKKLEDNAWIINLGLYVAFMYLLIK